MRWYWSGVAPIALCLWAGCNGILGIEPAELTDAGGAAGGTGGSGGSDASSGATGGIAGAGATGGAAGSDAGQPDSSSCVDTQSDVNNCGWCGHVCGKGTCDAGECSPETVAPLAQFGYELLLTTDHAWVTGSSDGKLYRIAKADGKVESWSASAGLYEMAGYGNLLYFNEYDSMKLWSLDITAPLPLTANPFATSTASISGLAADSSGVYYWNEGLDILRRASLDGKTVVDLATNVYNAYFLDTDATDIYFGRVDDGIYRISKSVPPPVDALNLPYVYDIPGPGPAAMMLDGDSIYYTSGDITMDPPPDQTQILQVGKDGTLKGVLATATTFILGLAIADGYIYWTEEGTLQNDFSDGAVRRVKLGDSTAKPETYATNQQHPVRVRVDGDYVYWLNSGWTSIAGGLMRVKR